MTNSGVATNFQDSYYKGDYHDSHELIKAVGPGKLWSKEFLELLRDLGKKAAPKKTPKEYAQWLHDLFLSNECTLKKVESKYDKIKKEIKSNWHQVRLHSKHTSIGSNDFFLIFALGTLKEMQHRGLFPLVIIKNKQDKVGPVV